MSTVANRLARAIATEDKATIAAIKRAGSPATWGKVFTTALSIMNSEDYEFTDFSAKVNSDSAEEVKVSSKAPHNED